MDDTHGTSTSRGRRRTSPLAVATELRRAIRSSQLAADALPTEDELSARLNATPASVREAIEILVARGELPQIPDQGPRQTPAHGRRRRRGPSSAASRIAEVLAPEIQHGKLAPGTPLPAHALAERFDTGTTTASEVTGLLAERGLVVVQGRGRPPLVAGEGVRRAPSTREVAEVLEREIKQGTPPPGTRLSASAVAKRFGTSAGLAHRAIAVLAERGLVTPRGRRRTALVNELPRSTDPHAEGI